MEQTTKTINALHGTGCRSHHASRFMGSTLDHALLLLAVQTGLRLTELTGLKVEDIHLGTGAYVRCQGKGRKNRCTPLHTQTVATRDKIARWRLPPYSGERRAPGPVGAA